jgi:hypothetical protein
VYVLNGGYPRVVTAGRGASYAPKQYADAADDEYGDGVASTPVGHIAQVAHTYGYHK